MAGLHGNEFQSLEIAWHVYAIMENHYARSKSMLQPVQPSPGCSRSKSMQPVQPSPCCSRSNQVHVVAGPTKSMLQPVQPSPGCSRSKSMQPVQAVAYNSKFLASAGSKKIGPNPLCRPIWLQNVLLFDYPRVAAGRPCRSKITPLDPSLNVLMFGSPSFNVWNDLPANIVSAPSIMAFKKHLHKLDFSKYLIHPCIQLK